MFRLVSFDVWGTLLLSNPAYQQRQRELLRDALGFPGEPAELRPFTSAVYTELDRETERSGAQFGMLDRVARLANRVELPVPSDSTLTTLRSALTEAQLAHPPFLTEMTLPALFETLRQTGLQLAVISNTNMTDGSIVHRALTYHGLARHLSFELYSNELGYAKPDPRIFRELVARSGVSPSDIVHVGDNHVTDKEGAIACGLSAILYDRKHRFPETSTSIWNYASLLRHVQ